MDVTRKELLAFMRRERFAVQASVAPNHNVQAAAVGIAVSDDFELVFDTLIDAVKAGGWAAVRASSKSTRVSDDTATDLLVVS